MIHNWLVVIIGVISIRIFLMAKLLNVVISIWSIGNIQKIGINPNGQ